MLFLFIYVTFALVDTSQCHPHDDEVSAELTNESHLYLHLLDDHHYVKYLRPAAKHNESLDVAVELWVTTLTAKPNSQDILISMDVTMKWHDPRLRWNVTEYGGIPFLVVPHDVIWMPHLRVTSEQTLEPLRSSGATLEHTGDVTVTTTVHVTSSCITDVTDFPTEVKQCDFISPFGHRHIQEQEFVIFRFANAVKGLVPLSDAFRSKIGSSWVFMGSEMSRAATTDQEAAVGSQGSRGELQMHFKMMRADNVKILILKTSGIIMAALLPVIFLFPPDSSAKIISGCLLLIAITLVLTTVTNHMLPTEGGESRGCPKIVVFFIVTMALNAGSVIISVIVATIARASPRTHMPSWARKIFFGTFGVHRFTRAPFSHDTMTPMDDLSTGVDADQVAFNDGDGNSDKDGGRGHHNPMSAALHTTNGRGSEWREAAILIDRVMFGVYVFVILSVSTSLLS
ncbi:unnamed protein product [Lymnaea stagnalis]|uniref:Uncharacterized protein n=1 Tax=Lymnaea stagnalis TaxID=6523 RepID=A0AAV2IBN7_LYMST